MPLWQWFLFKFAEPMPLWQGFYLQNVCRCGKGSVQAYLVWRCCVVEIFKSQRVPKLTLFPSWFMQEKEARSSSVTQEFICYADCHLQVWPAAPGAQTRFCKLFQLCWLCKLIMPIITVILIIWIILIIPSCRADKDNKTPRSSIACPEFADQCKIITGNGYLDLSKQLLFLVAIDFLMNDH